MRIQKIKILDHLFVWWPKIDEDIGKAVEACTACNSKKQHPKKTTLKPWEGPQNLWQKIHVDYLGPFNDHYYIPSGLRHLLQDQRLQVLVLQF